MNKNIQWAAIGFALACMTGCGDVEQQVSRSAVVERGSIRMVLPFRGELEARRVETIAVGVQGSATLVELVPEGTRVEEGEVLARFDASSIEQDLARQENEWIRACQELESLEKAELPLELIDLESKRMDALAERNAEEHFLEAVRSLAERGLMAPGEVAQQEAKVAALKTRGEQLDVRIELTQKHVHTARLAKAQAAQAAAERQRDFTARQLALCEMRAPVAGVVTRLPLPLNGEYRPAHVGDTLYHNQIFLCLPDPSEHVVRGFVSEAELPWIQPGRSVTATPEAFPELQLHGKIEHVGGMAQTRPGFPAWRKFFAVQIELEALPRPLPVGISIRAEVLAGEADDALCLPREAIAWRDGTAFVRATHGQEKAVKTGLASATHIEILSGVTVGTEVLLP